MFIHKNFCPEKHGTEGAVAGVFIVGPDAVDAQLVLVEHEVIAHRFSTDITARVSFVQLSLVAVQQGPEIKHQCSM